MVTGHKNKKSIACAGSQDMVSLSEGDPAPCPSCHRLVDVNGILHDRCENWFHMHFHMRLLQSKTVPLPLPMICLVCTPYLTPAVYTRMGSCFMGMDWTKQSACGSAVSPTYV